MLPRCCGILLHLSSLPGAYGIGAAGREAFAFLDFLRAAEQGVWQVLPLGPTGFGDSPYQSFSAFAGNPYFIDLETLYEEGLLTRAELDSARRPEGRADYADLYRSRAPLLRKAFLRADQSAAEAFAAQERGWLEDYALFMALKRQYGGAPLAAWPDGLRLRKPGPLAAAREALREETAFEVFLQHRFSRQWTALRRKARDCGVRLMGDMPIYVAADSADVWAHPDLFRLDAQRRPEFVAGVPPDYFSEDGQLWGNPLYNWDAMARTDYLWWRMRFAAAARKFDLLRLDHFRGLEAYYQIPAGAKSARVGEWVKGPGMSFVRALKSECPAVPVVAEDLGLLMRAVHALRRQAGWPGMAVLQFAFDSTGGYLPERQAENCAFYTGTHDNTTLRGWLDCAPEEELARVREYLGAREGGDLLWPLIQRGMDSPAELFVAQMQDYLDLPDAARMNLPGATGCWSWRMQPGACTDALAHRLAALVRESGRR